MVGSDSFVYFVVAVSAIAANRVCTCGNLNGLMKKNKFLPSFSVNVMFYASSNIAYIFELVANAQRCFVLYVEFNTHNYNCY